jgi:hypothetical protein
MNHERNFDHLEYFTKMKKLRSSNGYQNLKRPVTDWENIFANQIHSKEGLVLWMWKEFSKLQKKTNGLILELGKTFRRHSSREDMQ